MKHVTKKELIVFALIPLIIGMIYFAHILYKDAQVTSPSTNSEVLKPVSWEKHDERTVSLADRQRITFRKYGFRRKLKIKERTVVYQHIDDDFGMEHVKFGIYHDAALKDAVNEADVGYNMNAGWEMEEGGDPEDYPEYKRHMLTLLEPGDYYVAIYTTDASDDFSMEYASRYSVVKDEIALEEGKTERFFGNYNEETLFRMDIPAEGLITVDTRMFAGTLYLCDADKKEISYGAKVPIERTSEANVSFDIKAKGTYYLKLTDYLIGYNEGKGGLGKFFENYIKYEYQRNG